MSIARDTRPKVSSKPPKRRFSVGDEFTDLRDGEHYEVIGAYRLREDLHEWIWVLGSLTFLSGQPPALRALDELVHATRCLVVRVVADPFRSSLDAGSYFMQIPPRPGSRGDTVHVTNKNLLNSAKWRKVNSCVHD